jgi:serine/threonine-protein kinase
VTDDTGELEPGSMVGEYKVDRLIGSGGMGMVYAATQPLIGKRVAIKVLKPDVGTNHNAVERFIDEARVVNQIEHPNIVDIFAFGQLPDSRHYFVMEWLRGESLGSCLERGPLPVAAVCDILLPLIRALAAAHEHGVVHRDLKPDNVFLTERAGQFHIKLLDFGVAKLSHKDATGAKQAGHTATGVIVGTPLYLSPEQARGHHVDYRADIYALGVIAFHAATGAPPFTADNPMEVVAKHIIEPPRRPSTLAPEIPVELDELILASLAKDPSRRPELAHWLDALTYIRAMPAFSAQPTLPKLSIRPTPMPGGPLPHPGLVTTPNSTPSPGFTPQPTPPPGAWTTPPQPLQVAGKRRVPAWLVIAPIVLAAAVIAIVLMAQSGGSRGSEHANDSRVIAPRTPAAPEPVATQPTPSTAPVPTPTPTVAEPPTPVVTPPAAVEQPATGSATGSAETPVPVKTPLQRPHTHHPVAGSADVTKPAAPQGSDDGELLTPGSIPTGEAGSGSATGSSVQSP